MTRLAPASSTCRARSMEWMPPPAWHGQPLGNLRDQRGVIALAHGGVEVDQLHQRKARKLLDPVFEIVECKAQLFALHKLDDAAAQQIDRRNQHGSLTETPALASSSLSERALDTPK